jgi:hypothetical protein
MRMKANYKSELTTRRKFNKSVAAALITAPLVSSCGETGSPNANTQKPTSTPPQQSDTQRENKPRMTNEHIPPILITSGSFILEAEDIGNAKPNTHSNSNTRKKMYEVASTARFKTVKILNIDGSTLFTSVGAEGAVVQIYFTDLGDDKDEVRITNLKGNGPGNIIIEVDDDFKNPGNPNHAKLKKHEHKKDDIYIKHVVVLDENKKVLYQGSEGDEVLIYHVLIWP